MSDRLNDDVLVMILDELAAPAHTLGKYRARQATLRNVCLSSRRLCSLAQPRLWRQVTIRSRGQLQLVAAAAPCTLGRHTMYLTIVTSRTLSGGVSDAVACLSSVLPEVVEIRIGSLPHLDFALLSQYRKLRRLHVDRTKLLKGPCATFPALEELCLHLVFTTSAWVQQQLRAAHLPRLRELHFIPHSGTIRLDKVVSPAFLGQLDVLQTDILSLPVHCELAQDARSPVVVLHPESGPSQPLPFHTLCDRSLFPYLEATKDILSFLAQGLRLTPPAPSSTTPPRLLIIQVARRSIDMRPSVERRLRIVEALCVQKGVRLLWDDEELYGERFSPAFSRYARELRAARGLER
ncbi:hypothetical protein JCM3775_004992 [Rhodotorula graminis]